MVQLPKDKPRALCKALAFWGEDCLGCVHLRRKTTERVLIDGASIPSVDQHLDKSLDVLISIVSDQEYGSTVRREGFVVDGPMIHRLWSR